jgi:hypothetical protein
MYADPVFIFWGTAGVKLYLAANKFLSAANNQVLGKKISFLLEMLLGRVLVPANMQEGSYRCGGSEKLGKQ